MMRGLAGLALVASVACASDLPNVEDSGSSSTSTSATSTSDLSASDGVPETTTIGLDTTATEGGTQTSTTGPAPACDEPDGTYLGMCPESSPFCVGGECMRCDNADELTRCDVADGAPGDVCADDGRCVECTAEEHSFCDDTATVCDPETNTCVLCNAHEQCGMSACNLFEGRCVEGMVVNVVPGAGALQAAVTAVTAGGGGTIVLTDGTYDEAIVIGGGAVVAFLSAAGASPQWRHTMGTNAPQLRVTGGATVLVDGIEFRLNGSGTDPAIRVDGVGARYWVDRSTIAQNFGVGVRAEGGAELMMRDCFMYGDSNIDVLDVAGATATILYSTLGAEFGSSNAISCDDTAVVTVSDSILIAQDSTVEIACDGIMADHTVTNDMVLAGVGNTPVGATDEMWFVNYSTGDFHLTGDGVTMFANIAEWNQGDPTFDIDSEPRPTTDPTQDYAGADIP
jgi:hypothetical protein